MAYVPIFMCFDIKTLVFLAVPPMLKTPTSPSMFPNVWGGTPTYAAPTFPCSRIPETWWNIEKF